jgi:hypothetical protein
LEAEPWSSVRTIAEGLKIPASTVHLHLITSVNMKSRHFKCFPVFLMIIWEQNDWRVPDGFSTSCKHKWHAIFEI